VRLLSAPAVTGAGVAQPQQRGGDHRFATVPHIVPHIAGEGAGPEERAAGDVSAKCKQRCVAIAAGRLTC
jgi:hypothetical protein